MLHTVGYSAVHSVSPVKKGVHMELNGFNEVIIASSSIKHEGKDLLENLKARLPLIFQM